MQHKRKKVTRKRGSETHGHGASKKRRGAGHRGGRGKSGAGKRGDFKIAKVAKYNKKHHGKYGFKIKNKGKNIKSINLAEIQTKMNTYIKKGIAKETKGVYSLDLKDIGFNKLLSKGNVNLKLNITSEYASNNSIEKVVKAGGKVIVPQTSDNKENIKG